MVGRNTHLPSANGGVSLCSNRTIYNFIGNCGIQLIKEEHHYSDRLMKNRRSTSGLGRSEVEDVRKVNLLIHGLK